MTDKRVPFVMFLAIRHKGESVEERFEKERALAMQIWVEGDVEVQVRRSRASLPEYALTGKTRKRLSRN
jgi:hypothetical protein